MSDPTALSATHQALIEKARLHADYRLVPPERVRGRARRLLAEKLIALGVAESVEAGDAPWWTDPGRGPVGLRLAASMRPASEPEPPVEAPPAPGPVEPRRWTKIARVLDLLRRPEGADLPAIVSATDWLPHTARAALTGLRRKGYTIAAIREDGRTVYREALSRGAQG